MEHIYTNEFPSTGDSNATAIKRRKRLSLTCSSCRSRKIKCDQGRPCNNCVKKRIDRFCIYDSTPFLPDADKAQSAQEALQILKAENTLLKEQLEVAIKGGRTSSSPSSSTFFKTASSSASLAFLINDGTDELSSDYRIRNKGTVCSKKERSVYFGSTSWRSLLVHDVRHRDAMEKANSFVSNVRREWRIERNLKNVPHSIYQEAEAPNPEECLANLSQYLPSYDTIRDYLDYYLNSFYFQDISIIDSDTLIKDFLSLFTKTENGKCGFKITNKTIDYARIALIVAVIKLTTISISLACVDQNYDDRDVLVRYSERLLGFARHMVRSCIPSLQTTILLHQIKRLSPMDGDGGDGSHGVLTLRLAIDTAIAMGLHKDVDALYSSKPPSVRNQMRQIWKFLVKEDMYLSVKTGLPLAIDQYYCDAGSFIIESTDDQLALLARKIVRISTKGEYFSKNELLKAVKEMESFNNFEISRLSKNISSLKSEESILNSFNKISSIKERIFYIYLLHGIHEFLYNNCRKDDQLKPVFFNSSLKYAGLCLTHVIELASSFNKICLKASEANSGTETRPLDILLPDNKINPEAYRVLKIVDIACVMNGLTHVIFIKAFTGICTFELYKLFELDQQDPEDTNSNNTPDSKEQIHLNVRDLEQSDPSNMNSMLNKSSNNPMFLHSLLTLACKYMLYLQKESYGRVFSYNFTLYAIISIYKYFDTLVKQREKTRIESGKTPETKVSYDSKFKEGCSEMIDLFKSECSIYSRIQSYMPNQDQHKPSKQEPAGQEKDIVIPIPSLSLDNPLDNFDFFDWRNEEVDQMFNNLLTENWFTYPLTETTAISTPYTASAPISSDISHSSLGVSSFSTPSSSSNSNNGVTGSIQAGNGTTTSTTTAQIVSAHPTSTFSSLPMTSSSTHQMETTIQNTKNKSPAYWGNSYDLAFTPPNIDHSVVGYAGESSVRDTPGSTAAAATKTRTARSISNNTVGQRQNKRPLE